MKTKISSFRPTTKNLILLESVLRQAIRNGFRKRHNGFLPTIQKWNREDVREAVAAYRMIKATEISHVE
jgi:hypothetical protein